METRSRKRAEASSVAPSSSSSGPTTRSQKRIRLSAATPIFALTNRARASRSNIVPMDHTPPVESSSRSRRNKNEVPDKGKEKEHDVRVRHRNRGNLGLKTELGNFTGNDEDDNDSESGGFSAFHQNLTSASSALQGLLRKLGAGLDDLLPSSGNPSGSSSHQSGKLKKILSGLRAEGDDGKQMESLTQLCELLSIGTEESLSTFSVDSFLPVLVGLLNHESNPDIMLLAARAIAHLCDVLPSSCAAVVHYGAIPCFVARLLTIEYMDLAEQSLQALKKISQEHPTSCLRAGALMAVLSYLDFFSTGVQRVALSTAANMCKKLPSDAADFVMEAVPLLTNLLHHHDSKVLEHASVCLTRIAEALASFPDKLDELCKHGLVSQAASLISAANSGGGQASLSTTTYTGLIRLLSIFAGGSPVGAKTLLLLGISSILKDVLSGSGASGNSYVPPALNHPPEQIFEIVNLANELLPPLPQGMIAFPASSNTFVKPSATKKPAPPTSSTSQDAASETPIDAEVSSREKLLANQPELLQKFGMDLLSILIQTYGSSVNGPIRHKCLSAIGKLMYFSTPEMIQSLSNVTNLSSFLAGILAWKDPHVLIPSLQISEILMDKLPETFSKLFVREGVIHAIDQLILTGNHDAAPKQASSSEKNNDTVAGTSASSRARRYRRRTGSANSSEELKRLIAANTESLGSLEAFQATTSNLRSSVGACARAFKDKHGFLDPGATEEGGTDDLLLLKNLSMKLSGRVEDQKSKSKGKSKPPAGACDREEEEELVGVVVEILRELAKGDGVSTFEFVRSGVVAALLDYFSCGSFSRGRASEANVLKLREQALGRFKSFVAVGLPPGGGEPVVAPMAVLVQKLQQALSSLERFPVVLSRLCRPSSGSARLSSGLSVLSQPIKLRLCRANGEKSLRDYSSNIVLIDPLASLAAVEDFLWPRIQRGESSQKTTPTSVLNTAEPETASAVAATLSPSMCTPTSASRHSLRSRSALSMGDGSKREVGQEKSMSSSKGKGKAVLKPSPEDAKGPQTRNATRQRACHDHPSSQIKVKPVNVDSSSEEEEFDLSPDDIEDALLIEEEDISDDENIDDRDVLRDGSLPVCISEKVHDVKLIDEVEDGNGAATSTSDSQLNHVSGSSSRAATVMAPECTDLRTSVPFSPVAGMSFAAAAMSGLGSANARAIRGGRDRQGRLIFGSPNEPPKLIFSAAGKQLNRHLTIYQAIQHQLVQDKDEADPYGCSDFISSDGSRLWSNIHSITYQRADPQVEKSFIASSSSAAVRSMRPGSSNLNHIGGAHSHQISLLDSLLHWELPCDLDKSNPTYEIMALLRVLDGLNKLAPRLRIQLGFDHILEGKGCVDDAVISTMAGRVPAEDFINNKLTPKLASQIQDALALCCGSVPVWCYQLTRACPFLFPFETRRQYFHSTAFGLSRALYRLQQQQSTDGHGSTNERELRIGRLQRQKVRVSRNRILDSAAKVMDMYSSQKAVLEVEYFGEVGTGLGPTLEFYTLLSHELQKVSLGMWRSGAFFVKSSMEVDGEEEKAGGGSGRPINGDFVQAQLGLFPRPCPPNADVSAGTHLHKVLEYFRLTGRVMAKALQDGRLLDLSLSLAFYKLVLGQELDLYDILYFDAEFGKILQELHALVCQKKYIESTGVSNAAISDLRFRGALLEDLCLDFTLPGYPEYVLKMGDETVNINNLEEYLSLVINATVNTGIMRQIEAFREGFNQVFDISSLQIFTSQELEYLLCGRRELWEPESLADHLKFDHGYTAKSAAIVNLLEIMGEFTPDQQRAFCQFVTGAPRLPPGGLAVLNPKLTIVRKHSSSAGNAASNGIGSSETADSDLPSVMTCANYLKLPPYSTKEIMYKKLHYAIHEGQGSFDLS